MLGDVYVSTTSGVTRNPRHWIISPPMNQMPSGEELFESACKQLHIAARVNAEGVASTFDLYVMESSPEHAEMCADSVSFAMGQLPHFIRAFQLLALDLETAAAVQVR